MTCWRAGCTADLAPSNTALFQKVAKVSKGGSHPTRGSALEKKPWPDTGSSAEQLRVHLQQLACCSETKEASLPMHIQPQVLHRLLRSAADRFAADRGVKVAVQSSILTHSQHTMGGQKIDYSPATSMQSTAQRSGRALVARMHMRMRSRLSTQPGTTVTGPWAKRALTVHRS